MLQTRTADQMSGVAYGAMTGLMIAAYTLVDGYGVKHLLIAPLVLSALGLASAALTMVAARPAPAPTGATPSVTAPR